jgi:hypothetical protein
MSNNDIPAFPIPLQPGQPWQGMAPCDGMTLRDYFAAKAMQGLLASEVQANTDEFALYAYAVADAMLKAREE